MRAMKMTGATVLALVLLAGCGSSSSGRANDEDAFDVTGTLLLSNGSFNHTGPVCQGKGGYDDIQAGADVVIRNGSGDKIALGSLEPGDYSTHGCEFAFVVEDVPRAEQDIYSVEVTHRGEINFTEAESAVLALTLG